MLSLACRDIGIMDCEYVARGETAEEFWGEAAEHIIKMRISLHNLKRVTNGTSNILKNQT